MSLATVILAAWMGKRMNDPTKSKVMFSVGGKPMIEHVIETALQSGSERIVVIVGFLRDQVIAFVTERFNADPRIEFAVQEEQLGTGHAVAQAEAVLSDFSGDVIILSGDVPLLRAETISKFRSFHLMGGFQASLISCHMEEPFGYGRIIRSTEGIFTNIVEQKDANEEQKKITEVNSGVYIVNGRILFDALQHIDRNNAAGEYYLTDIFPYITKHSGTIGACVLADSAEIAGANTVEQLSELNALYASR